MSIVDQEQEWTCCELMTHALEHAIIRTRPPRFGPDVLDPPLHEIYFCPWCGFELKRRSYAAADGRKEKP